MKMPKVGAVVYAFSHPEARVGSTEFVSATQENCSTSRRVILEEIEGFLDEPVAEDENGTYTVGDELEVTAEEIVIWKMERVQ